MAEWIVTGHPEWDMWRLDVRRFGANYASQAYTLARTVETYAKYYDIHYPNEERQSARPLRLSPAYARLQALGASFGEKTGWERPNWFTPYEAAARHGHEPRGWARHHWSPAIGVEHLATRSVAGLFDETSFSKLEVRGPGALALLQNLCANNVDRPVGSAGLHLHAQPARRHRVRFYGHPARDRPLPDRHRHRLWRARPLVDHAPPAGRWLGPRGGCHVVAGGVWTVGAEARAILERVTKANVSNAAFPYLTAQALTVGDVPALALRVTYVGELGWEFYCPMEYGQRLWDTIWEAGQPEGLLAGGYRAIDSLRLEKGYRYWSADIGPDYTPYEAGLGFAVRLDKGEFIGRDALLRQKAEGLRRKLCCLTLADPSAVAIGNEPVRHGEQVAGWVTSGGYGYSVEKSIAYAYFPLHVGVAGTVLDVEILGERIPATVVREPLWDPKNERIKS